MRDLQKEEAHLSPKDKTTIEMLLTQLDYRKRRVTQNGSRVVRWVKL